MEMTKIHHLVGFEMRCNRRSIIGWSIAIFCVMFLYMILFPSVQEIAEVKMNAMPKALLQFVGMEGFDDMGNFVTYFGMIYKLVLVAVSLFAITFSAGLIAKSERNSTIELINSLNVSRGEIYWSKVLTAFVSVTLVLMAGILSAIVCGFINGGKTFDIVEVVQLAKMMGFIPYLFMGIGLMLAGISPGLGNGAIASMVVLVSYLLGYLGLLLGDKAQWLIYLSPFESVAPDKALAMSQETWVCLGVYAVIMSVSVVVGLLVYRKRDLKL